MHNLLGSLAGSPLFGDPLPTMAMAILLLSFIFCLFFAVDFDMDFFQYACWRSSISRHLFTPQYRIGRVSPSIFGLCTRERVQLMGDVRVSRMSGIWISSRC